jgi:DNA-directed RNA polymerase specialized sigma subunit
MKDKFLALNDYIELAMYVISEYYEQLNNNNRAITYIAFGILKSDLKYHNNKNISRENHRYKAGLWALLEYIKLKSNNVKATNNILKIIQKIDLTDNLTNFKELTEEEKHILNLKFIERFSKSKISILYGISQKKLEDIIDNAIKKIKKSLFGS